MRNFLTTGATMTESEFERPPESVARAIEDLNRWVPLVVQKTAEGEPAQRARELLYVSQQLLELSGACLAAARSLQRMACDLDERLQKE
jgi:hypothetical protein